jgi:lysophospholipase L1-like esterase
VVRLAETQARKLADAHPDGQLIFSIMLGTNDSANRGPHGSPIAAEHYQQNLKLIADRLIAGHPDCLIFIHHPIFYTKNTHNSSDYEGDSAYERLRSYFPVIAALIAGDEQSTPRHLYPGDIDAYDHFAQSWQTELTPEQGQHGTFYLHPNLKGAEALGKYWAAAILKQIE